MKKGILKKAFTILLVLTIIVQPINWENGATQNVWAEASIKDDEMVIGTFYNYGKRQVDNHSNLGLYCDWTTIDGGKALDMTANGLDKGAYLHITVELSAIRNGKHVTDFELGNFYFKLRSVDNNGENNFGWSGVTLKEGTNQLDIPLYSNASSYVGTKYSNTTRTGTMDWSKLNRLIFVSLDAKNYYGTDTDVSMTLSDVCIVCPKDARDPGAYENVRIAEPTSGVGSEDMIVYTVDAAEDMGADKSGNTDSTAAIQKAIDSVKASGGVVFLPSGQYKVDGTLDIPQGVTLRGEWRNPNDGGLGKGTILKAYHGAGNENGQAFISMASGSCLRDISIWYPNQNASSPVAYPYTIDGSGHTSVYNITLYNSYNGFKNNSCSSMLIRGMYGTVLNNGIWGAYAYDVPRIEQVYFDTAYWAGSGLNSSPLGNILTALNTYCETNLTAIIGGEQDWGYWYDINVNHAKYGCYLTAVMDNNGSKVAPGNIAVGDLTTENVDYGIYIHSISYPGLELTYSDISAKKAGIYYAPKPADSDYLGNGSGSVKAAYYDNATVMITKTKFSGGGYAYQGMNNTGTHSAANFNNCVFETWADAAIYLAEGNLVCSNGEFQKEGRAITLESNVVQGVLSGNTFASGNALVYDADTTKIDVTEEKVVPDTPDYSYDFAPSYNPATSKVFNVERYGAIAGVTDNTSAFQNALNDAKAAGGGTVYVPSGSYILKGSLTVPKGVELRGSFDGAHYGNSTSNGSVLYVYANKDNENAEAFITLEDSAGVRGFTIIYPEQGITDNAAVDEPVHKYPATIELNKKSWVRTCSINGAYTMLDAMTNVCDDFVLNDVTGCCMGYGLLLGHGTNGGYVQDYHSNYTSWPSNYLHAYKGNVDVTKYTTQNTTWMQLGDYSNVKFFSDFSILISTGMELIKDPYTGKCTQDMVGWGTAFDATGNGIIGENGANSNVTLLSSMGVFNQHDTSYNIITEKDFTGTINLFNADVWSPDSRLVNVAGGTVNLVQYLSWCCYNGICHDGGTVNMYGSTFVGADTGSNIGIIYEEGAKGEVIGNNNNYGNFNIIVKPGATDVEISNNGIMIDRTSDIAVEFNTYAPGTYTSKDGVVTTGWKALTPLKLSNGNTQNHASLGGYSTDDLYMKVVFTIDKGNNTASDTDIFKSGTISLRQAWSKNDGTDDAICFHLYDEHFNVQTGKEQTLYMPLKAAIENNSSFNWNGVKFVNVSLNTGNYTGISMKVTDIRIVDNSVTDYWKYQLYQTLKDNPDVTEVDKNIGKDYIDQIETAKSLYQNVSATMEELREMIDEVKKAAAEYGKQYQSLRDGWVATASLNNGEAGRALDNDITTRWATNTYQEPGQWFMVDFGKSYSFNTLVLDVGSSTNDGPAGYEVYVSDDGENWGAPVALGTANNDVITFATRNNRYLKIVQTGNKNLYWSIHELYVMETTGDYGEVSTYSVMLDGKEVMSVEEGETYTLPRTARVGYYADGKMYKKGSTYTVTKDVNFSSVDLTANTGASIRLADPSGLTFKASITCNDSTLFTSNAIVSEGMLITTNDIYSEEGSLDLTSEYTYLNIVNSGWNNNTPGAFAGTVAGIQSMNYGRTYIARAYVTVRYADGTEGAVYSKMTGVRSVASVATSMRNTPSVYNALTTAQKALIDTFAAVQ